MMDLTAEDIVYDDRDLADDITGGPERDRIKENPRAKLSVLMHTNTNYILKIIF